MQLGTEVDLRPGDIVRWGTSSPKKGAQQPAAPTFRPMYCGQMAGWIKMLLGAGIGLDAGHIVLHGDPAPPTPKGHSSPLIFGPCLLWPNGWMDHDAAWCGGRPRPWPRCVRWGPKPASNGHSPPLNYWPMSVTLLWPSSWMDQDATWYGCRPWLRRHCIIWGPSSPKLPKGHSLTFLAHVCCGQSTGWIKMPLGMKVDLGRGHIVLDGDPAPPRPCLFGPFQVIVAFYHWQICCNSIYYFLFHFVIVCIML